MAEMVSTAGQKSERRHGGRTSLSHHSINELETNCIQCFRIMRVERES